MAATVEMHDAGSGDEGNRRSEILNAAARLFREKGYNGTTIRDIAAAVGMRSGSPFYHFKTKHDMLRAVVLAGVGVIHEAVMDAAQGVKDPRQRFERMAEAHLDALLGAEGGDFVAVLVNERGALEPDALAEVQARKDAYETLWSKTLEELAASGQLVGDMRLVRLLVLGALNWSRQWYKPEGGAGPAQISRQLCQLLFRD